VGKQRDEKLRVSEPEPAWRIVDMERLSDATLANDHVIAQGVDHVIPQPVR
jgi:hypothetical protein